MQTDDMVTSAREEIDDVMHEWTSGPNLDNYEQCKRWIHIGKKKLEESEAMK